jgi:hypothetical protein
VGCGTIDPGDHEIGECLLKTGTRITPFPDMTGVNGNNALATEARN